MLGLTSDIKIKVESEKDCVQKVSVEWASSIVKAKIEEAFKSVQTQAKLPGFRPGKSPIELVKKAYTGAAYERAQDLLLREGVTEAIKQKKLNPVQPPVIQTVTFDPEKSFQFEFEVEVSPTFKLAGAKGIALTKKRETPNDEDIDKTLKELADTNSKLVESKAETLSAMQYAVVNYEGFMDGKPIDGAKAENFLIDMAAPQAIVGLSEGLLGAKVSEEREVSVKFPEDSPSKELAGKEGKFKIKLNAIKEKVLPTLDDDFAKDLGLESFEQLKSKVLENLGHELRNGSLRDIRNQIADRLLEKNEFTVPQSLVTKQAEYLAARQQERLLRQGFLKDDIGKLLENMKAEIKRQAEREIRLQYIIETIAENEKIDVTEPDISAEIEKIVGSTEPKNRKATEEMLRGRYLQTMRLELRDNKVYDWVIKNGKVTQAQEAKTK